MSKLEVHTKSGLTVNLFLENIKEVVHKANNYIRVFYMDGSVRTFAYNTQSFSFPVDYVVQPQEINRLINVVKDM